MHIPKVYAYQRTGHKHHKKRKLLNIIFMSILMGHPVSTVCLCLNEKYLLSTNHLSVGKNVIHNYPEYDTSIFSRNESV